MYAHPDSLRQQNSLLADTKPLLPVYVAQIFYVAALALTKVSLVCMYLRIFWAHPPFKLACYGALAFIIIPSTAILATTIVSCDPVPFFWDRDLSAGQCLDVTALAYANSAFAAAQDALLIALPIAMLWQLNMSTRKKIHIGVMFAVGSLGLVATIIRLFTLHIFGNLADPTWDYVAIVYWTTIELAAGLIASCLPAVRMLLDRIPFSGGIFHIGSTNRTRSRSGGGGDKGAAGPHILMEVRRRPTAEVGVDEVGVSSSAGGRSFTWKDEVDGWDDRSSARGGGTLTSSSKGGSAGRAEFASWPRKGELREEVDVEAMGRAF